VSVSNTYDTYDTKYNAFYELITVEKVDDMWVSRCGDEDCHDVIIDKSFGGPQWPKHMALLHCSERHVTR
jgi:hypothetical protein